MNQLEQIEQWHGFKYPELYHRLYNDGMLDWGEFGPNWHATYWEKFKINPPLLLLGNDIELLDLNRRDNGTSIIENIGDFESPDCYLQIKPEFKFIPFAKTGGGDFYVFQFDKQNGDDVPVTLVPHDYMLAEVLAKNLQDFIFRMLLECVVDIDEHTRIADGDLKTNLFNMLKTHKPYLSQNQAAKVEEIYSRDLFKHILKYPNGNEESLTGLISMDEIDDTLRQEIGFEGLDEEFQYTSD